MPEEIQVDPADRFRGEYPPILGFQPDPDNPLESLDIDSPLESQCGMAWDAQDVEQYDGTLGVTQPFVQAHEPPVGQIRWNNNLASIYTNPGDVNNARWCTGTLISDNLLLTAAHCFEDSDSWNLPQIDGTTNVIPPAEIARNMRVEFNYQRDPAGNARPVQSFAIAELLERRLGNLDYAIVRLEGIPSNQFGTTPISPNDAAINDMLCIIGHPVGRPKQIEAGPATGFNATGIQYGDIDTLGGNSGSGSLHSVNQNIVGVHTNGGCTTTGGFNRGVRITSIINASPIVGSIVAAQRMRLAEAMWTHGHKIKIEYPDRISAVKRRGFHSRIEAKRNTNNWFHFAIPTPVIVEGRRSRVGSVMLRHRTSSASAVIHAVHIYDGENKIASYDNMSLSPNRLRFQRFEIPTHPEIRWGLGISIGVRFTGSSTRSNAMEFSAAGCDFLL